jgi:hypothetical protein
MKPYEYYIPKVPFPTTVLYSNILADLETDNKYCIVTNHNYGHDVFKNERYEMTKMFNIESTRQLYDWCVEEEVKYKLSILAGYK